MPSFSFGGAQSSATMYRFKGRVLMVGVAAVVSPTVDACNSYKVQQHITTGEGWVDMLTLTPCHIHVFRMSTSKASFKLCCICHTAQLHGHTCTCTVGIKKGNKNYVAVPCGYCQGLTAAVSGAMPCTHSVLLACDCIKARFRLLYISNYRSVMDSM